MAHRQSTPPSPRELAPTLAAQAGSLAFEAGQVLLGRYRLERRLGAGGMGELWRAVNIALDQPVAVKLLRRASRNPDGASRLLREARIAARLEHRAIVRVFDAGTLDDGAPIVVMELLEGQDAGDHLRDRGPLDAVSAVQLVIPIVAGLGVAHARGVVHRDIKPDNVFLARLGDGTVQPKLIDFGVAHVAAQMASSKLTVAGMLLGTPDYMAPEQVECRDDIDHRADLWAVGVTLYHLVAGTVPFTGKDLPALFDAILEGHVPFPTKARGLDGALWAIVMDCLRRDRDERFQGAAEVEWALSSWLAQRGVSEDYARHGLVVGASPVAAVAEAPRPPPSAPAEKGQTLDRAIFSALKKKPQ